jgi:hypothetical protein
MPSRQIFGAIVYVLRVGCQWKASRGDGVSKEYTPGSTDSVNCWSASKKTEKSFIAFLSLAAAILCWRQTISIHG